MKYEKGNVYKDNIVKQHKSETEKKIMFKQTEKLSFIATKLDRALALSNFMSDYFGHENPCIDNLMLHYDMHGYLHDTIDDIIRG